MSLITTAMRRVLAGDESTRALDPNGLRLRSSARLPRTIRARWPGRAIARAHLCTSQAAMAARLHERAEALVRAFEVAQRCPDVAEDQPTPYVRETYQEDAVWPQVMRGFA